MMSKFSKIAGLGLMALMLSGTALANGHGVYGGYPDSYWSGGVTVYGDSSGYSGYSGTINLNGGYAPVPVYAPVYAPVYVPVAVPRHGPRGHHRPKHRHSRHHGNRRCRGHGRGCRY
jgi:hypothetical protein